MFLYSRSAGRHVHAVQRGRLSGVYHLRTLGSEPFTGALSVLGNEPAGIRGLPASPPILGEVEQVADGLVGLENLRRLVLIKSIMEGGEAAFNLRKEKYGF